MRWISGCASVKHGVKGWWSSSPLHGSILTGDNGAGIGASHQTGWTGLVAQLIQYCGIE
ncbi:MAG: hypothetical protein HC835_06150 [Oscillatoriales cyanobacterium RM2_1_1]|nr:hypothetical protein [Oscillatoriales cyanobacterium SM2_3_0]NJO45236.1 hypothetical protein [Oscillatoriales cyanobacterium RM2_1_1]